MADKPVSKKKPGPIAEDVFAPLPEGWTGMGGILQIDLLREPKPSVPPGDKDRGAHGKSPKE